MSTYVSRKRSVGRADSLIKLARELLPIDQIERKTVFGLIIIGALIAFEGFNFGTTEFALTDLLGELKFIGIRWSTLLALAFCCMDFAGIARLFSPEHKDQELVAVWYLLGAWFLAATMNAILTWWAMSLALIGHQGLGNEVIGRDALLSGVPIFIAVLIWLIRVLIIGTFTLKGENLFSNPQGRVPSIDRQIRPVPQSNFSGKSNSGPTIKRPTPQTPIHDSTSSRHSGPDQRTLRAGPPRRR